MRRRRGHTGLVCAGGQKGEGKGGGKGGRRGPRQPIPDYIHAATLFEQIRKHISI